MALIDTNALRTGERLPGWRDRTFNTEKMTFAHFDFDAGSKIHEHCHSNEEVWTVLEGELGKQWALVPPDKPGYNYGS
jgi:quercetin dioxygenase-like cupin family protein